MKYYTLRKVLVTIPSSSLLSMSSIFVFQWSEYWRVKSLVPGDLVGSVKAGGYFLGRWRPLMALLSPHHAPLHRCFRLPVATLCWWLVLFLLLARGLWWWLWGAGGDPSFIRNSPDVYVGSPQNYNSCPVQFLTELICCCLSTPLSHYSNIEMKKWGWLVTALDKTSPES